MRFENEASNMKEKKKPFALNVHQVKQNTATRLKAGLALRQHFQKHNNNNNKVFKKKKKTTISIFNFKIVITFKSFSCNYPRMRSSHTPNKRRLPRNKLSSTIAGRAQYCH